MQTLTTSGNAPGYFAAHSADAFERERLDLLGQLMNPMTCRHLSRLGVGPGWRCLEIGAGNGSVARWLAGRVGATGQVVATDINPRFLSDLGAERIEVRRHDIVRDDIERNHYDLVHCRALLMHLREPERALARMAAALRPGGWLLIEECDIESLADPAHPAATCSERIRRHATAALEASGRIDLRFGRRCRALVEGLGLADVGDERTAWSFPGSGVAVRFHQMSIQLLGEIGEVVAQDDCEQLPQLCADDSFTPGAMVSAWGRRAPRRA